LFIWFFGKFSSTCLGKVDPVRSKACHTANMMQGQATERQPKKEKKNGSMICRCVYEIHEEMPNWNMMMTRKIE
jgi:hypothetical protein